MREIEKMRHTDKALREAVRRSQAELPPMPADLNDRLFGRLEATRPKPRYLRWAGIVAAVAALFLLVFFVGSQKDEGKPQLAQKIDAPGVPSATTESTASSKESGESPTDTTLLPPAVLPAPHVDIARPVLREKTLAQAEPADEQAVSAPSDLAVTANEPIEPVMDARLETPSTVRSEGTLHRISDWESLAQYYVATVDEVPRYLGWYEEFDNFLLRNLIYPEAALRDNAQGEVFVLGIVEVDGNLSDCRTLTEPHPALGDEVLRVVKHMRFTPAQKDGKAVRSYYGFCIDAEIGPNGGVFKPRHTGYNTLADISSFVR